MILRNYKKKKFHGNRGHFFKVEEFIPTLIKLLKFYNRLVPLLIFGIVGNENTTSKMTGINTKRSMMLQ